LEEMEIISAVFAGSVIREGFGKLSSHVTLENCPPLFPWLTLTGRSWFGLLKLHCQEVSGF